MAAAVAAPFMAVDSTVVASTAAAASVAAFAVGASAASEGEVFVADTLAAMVATDGVTDALRSG